MSLMPRSRLICDSARSPIGAASAAAMPITIIVNNPPPSKVSPRKGRLPDDAHHDGGDQHDDHATDETFHGLVGAGGRQWGAAERLR